MHISEELTYLTQIHKSYSGVEQRQALRTKPRRIMSFDYLAITPMHSHYLRSVSYGKQTEAMKVPLWYACTLAKQNIKKDSTIINILKEDLWYYRDIGNLLLWYDDNYGGNYFKMRSMAADGSILLDKKVGIEWSAGKTMIFPAAWSTLRQDGTYTMASSVVGETKLSYEFLVDYESPGIPVAFDEYHDEEVEQPFGRGIPPVYNGLEVFMTPPSWTKDPSSGYQRNANRLDNKTGVFFYDLKSAVPTENVEHEYVGLAKPEINNLQRFFTRCRGRWKSFYAPTWFNDFQLQEDALPGQSYFYVRWPLYFKYYQTSKRRSIAVFFRDGTGTILDVAGYAMDDKQRYGKIYLEKPLKMPLMRDKVQLISFLCRYRHDNDTMVTDFDTQQIASTVFRFAEVIE